MVESTIVQVVQQYLHNLHQQGVAAEFAVVFGSQSTGNAGAWSDIDLLVVSPQYDEQRLRSDVNLLWRVAARTDTRIEPVAVGLRQYDEDQSSMLIEIARREGQVIPFAG